MLTTWSPNLASTKPVHAVQLDLSVKALSAPVPGANAATSTKPNWITDFTYLASHGRVSAPLLQGTCCSALVLVVVLALNQYSVTDSLPSLPKFVASSGERDLWFFDSNSFEPLLVVRT